MYTYFSKKYDYVNLGNSLSKKCEVSFFAQYILHFRSVQIPYVRGKSNSTTQKFGRLQCIFMFNYKKNYYAAVGQKASFES